MQLYVFAHVIVYVNEMNSVKWSSWYGEEKRKIDFFVRVYHQETLLYGNLQITQILNKSGAKLW